MPLRRTSNLRALAVDWRLIHEYGLLRAQSGCSSVCRRLALLWVFVQCCDMSSGKKRIDPMMVGPPFPPSPLIVFIRAPMVGVDGVAERGKARLAPNLHAAPAF